jgi:hypothetical protein
MIIVDSLEDGTGLLVPVRLIETVYHVEYCSTLHPLDRFLQMTGTQFLVFLLPFSDYIEPVLQLLSKANRTHYLLLPPRLEDLEAVVSHKLRQVAGKFETCGDLERLLQVQTEFEWVWICNDSLLQGNILSRLSEAGLKLFFYPIGSVASEGCHTSVRLQLDKLYLDAVYSTKADIAQWKEYYSSFQKDCGVLCYHQGWTDIINSSAMLSYFGRFYKRLILIIREDTEELYSLLGPSSCSFEFVKGPPATWYDFIHVAIPSIQENLIGKCDYHLIGGSDMYRLDSYRNAFRQQSSPEFWVSFYSAYSIPYCVRVNYFDFRRDYEAENILFEKTVKTQEYNVVHLTERNNLHIEQEEENKLRQYECYELHQISPRFFDALKILKNAKGIYLIDSLWAAICYHIDAKYRLFSHIPVTVYCLRNYTTMFTKPVSLPNWTIRT